MLAGEVLCDICPSRASALVYDVVLFDNDKQLDRDTKVLFAAYFVDYEELKKHY